MSTKVTFQKIFLTPRNIDETFSKIQLVLSNIGLKNLEVKESNPSSFLSLEYLENYQKCEIQVYFEPKKTKTIFCVNLIYSPNEQIPSHFVCEQFKNNYSFLISQRKILEDIRLRMTATEILSSAVFKDSDYKKGKEITDRSHFNPRIIDFQCPTCEKSFYNPKELREHRDKTHKTKKIIY
jgi:hypothetical protein